MKGIERYTKANDVLNKFKAGFREIGWKIRQVKDVSETLAGGGAGDFQKRALADGGYWFIEGESRFTDENKIRRI